ncbi:MAG: tetratricopeptide repeat protein, partial [Myxococcota bacterium]
VRARHRRLANELAGGVLQKQLDGRLPGLGEVVARCLAALPSDRFATCRAVREAVLALDSEGDSLADFLPEASEDGAAPDDDATSLAIGPSNIPASDEDALVGRTNDLVQLAAAVQDHRLVAVHGPGGMGKSALVRRYGATSARRFTGGAWLCDAAAAYDMATLCTAVSGALGLPLGEGSTDEVIDQVGHQLRVRGELVLILDDIDRAVGAAREVLARWLRIAEQSRFVVTSRHRLRIPDEEVLELGPLAPADAVDLLRDRAGRAGRAAAAWTNPDAEPTLLELARRLDGLPLAVELAAGRARLLTPDQLLDRLDDRFRILGDGDGRSLQGVLQESWALLPEDQRDALASLSVFRDGFTVGDAEGVLVPEGGSPWVLDVLGALLDRSLLAVRDAREGQPRFALYESIRLFATQHVGDPTSLALRHARWFARLGRTEHLAVPAGDPMRERLARDLSNLEAGVEAAIEGHDPMSAAGCAIAAGRVFAVRGPVQRGLDLVRRALSVAPEHAALCAMAVQLGLAAGVPDVRVWAERACTNAQGPLERTDALHVLGLVEAREGKLAQARGTLERALREARQLGNLSLEGSVALTLGKLLGDLKRLDARGMLGYALRLGRRNDDPALQTDALIALGRHCRDQDDLEAARRWLQQALALGEDQPLRTANALLTLGSIERMLGNLPDARNHFLAALSVHRRLGLRQSEASSLASLAVVAGQTGDLVEARDRLEAASRLSLELGDRVGSASMRMNRGAMVERIGDLAAAREDIESARGVFEELGMVVPMSNADTHLALLDLEAGQPEAALERARTMHDAVAPIERGAGAQRIAALTLMTQAASELGRSRDAL